ncbi:MAG: excalibur calcium-binding domain-containing protein [Rhodobacteraceae bacterium]|nr:excalibur calcium-binding domain-containing protein [Paracoccaceae bacterium]
MRRFAGSIFLICLAMPALPLVDAVLDVDGVPNNAAPVTLDHPFFAPFLQAQSYTCQNATCSQISSCEEACYKLVVCGHRRRDGDNDGIPCENLCSRRCPR